MNLLPLIIAEARVALAVAEARPDGPAARMALAGALARLAALLRETERPTAARGVDRLWRER